MSLILLWLTMWCPLSQRLQAMPQDAAHELQTLAGDWLYVQDRTEGREPDKQQPPMSAKFALRVESDAVFLVESKGEKSISLDGSVTESVSSTSTTRYRGTWQDGALRFETEILSNANQSRIALIRREFRPTPDGLVVRVVVGDPAAMDSIALYQHPDKIELPKPAKATIDDLAWLAQAWVGTRGKSAIEERWGPPSGGAMLGVSRTVARDRMVAFEYLRIIQRDEGLVYVAQPGGKAPTEFVLTRLEPQLAVFENPRHDFPQRIAYELSEDGQLTASIGFIQGGRPQAFEFRSETDQR